MPESAFAYLPLTDDSGLRGLQGLLSERLAGVQGIEWQKPDMLHITLAYAIDATDEQLAGAATTVRGKTLSFKAERLSSFHHDGNAQRAIVLLVEPNEGLCALQQQVYDAFRAEGVPLSEYSAPDLWQPHITLCYVPATAEAPDDISWFYTGKADAVVYGRDDYKPFIERQLKTRGSMPDMNEILPDETEANVDANMDSMKALHFGSDVKLRADGSTVEGYLVLFGAPDTADFDGDFFTKSTDFDVDWDEGGKSTVYFNHGLDPLIKRAKLGGGQKATLALHDEGVWIEARLKEGAQYDEMVKQLMLKRRTGWSSGVPAHLVERERVGKAQHVTKWSLGADASITHLPNDWRNIATLKSLADTLHGAAAADAANEEAPQTDVMDGVDTNALPLKAALQTHEDNNIMNEEQLQQLATQVVTAVVGELKAQVAVEDTEKLNTEAAEALKALAGDVPEGTDEAAHALKAALSAEYTEQVAKLVNQVAALRQQQIAGAVKGHFAASKPQSQVEGYRGAQERAAIQVKSKYADLSASDMAYLYQMRVALAQAQGVSLRADNLYVREMFDKAQKSYAKGDLKLGDDSPSLKALTELKSNELDTSTQSGYGDEWVPDLTSADLWERSRLDNVVFPRIRTVEMPSNPFELPVQTTDPTVYKIAETVDESTLLLSTSSAVIPDSKVATTKVTLTAAKLGLRTMWSTEADEDSIIPFIANARAQSMRATQDAIDNVILNGDTATTLNVNSDGETISDTTRKYLVFNGMIKAPLVTTTSMSINASGATPTLALLRRARATLLNAYGTDIRNLMWVTDYATYIKMLAIDEVSSAANRGSVPTGVTGVLGGIDGIDLFVSNEMALADTDGKITQSTAGTTGRALLVHRPSWVVGFRRRITSTLKFFPEYDMYALVNTVRIALVNRDTQATSIVFNIGV